MARRQKPTLLKNLFLFSLCFLPLACMYSCRQNPKTTSTPLPQTRRNVQDVAELPVQEAPQKTPSPPDIRVAVMKDVPLAKITGGRNRRATNAAGRLLLQVPDDALATVAAGASGLVVNGAPISDSSITFQSASNDEPLRINDQEVAARVTFYRPQNGNGVNVVAVLNLEEYLAGVLAGEVPFNQWHPEALRAQAVTSRSFAWQQIRNGVNAPYDVESTVMSQVFKVGYRRNPTLYSATQSTRGLILTDNGTPFTAYFHSTCGGHTDAAQSVFPKESQCRPLSGVTCGFCNQSQHFRWNASFSKAAIEQKLKPAVPSLNYLSGIEFLDARGAPLTSLSRCTQVRLRHSGGVSTISGNQFRLLVSPKDLKSLLFEQVVDRGDSLEIAGAGFGHGVGLCQYGSQGMATAGFSHLQILGKYFPGAALTKVY